jgi:hypothetical protein
VASFAVHGQRRRHAEPRRPAARRRGPTLQHLELADLVEPSDLGARVGDRHAFAADAIARAELVLRVGGLADGDGDLAILGGDAPPYAEQVALVGMASLVERSRQPDARLNSDQLAAPRGLARHRLWEAHAEDQIPYIERLADHWGELCGSKEVASAWADRLLDITRMALSPDKNVRGYFHGTAACLSALYRAERYDDLLDVLKAETFWPYKRWAVKALGAAGKKAEAIRLAESSRGPWTSDADVDALCEEMLLSSGLVDEAYSRYGLRANRGGTYLATFRAVARKYPHKRPEQILADLVKATPGDEGKWFAAAKDLGLYDAAIELARASPCDPKTLARAARDHVTEEPAFAIEAGYAALDWLAKGFGYEITSADVWMAYSSAMKAAEALGRAPETKERIRKLADDRYSFVTQVLGRELGLPR